MPNTKELVEELQSVLNGKGMDTLLPTLVFVGLNQVMSLGLASVLAIVLAFVIGVIRLIQRESWGYAFAGLLSVSFASMVALLANNAKNYFLPGIVSSLFLTLGVLLSLILKKPAAALMSHLTRGWPMAWFMRNDIKPAYTEVTIMWFVFMLARSILLLVLFNQNDIQQFTWMNTLLGLPVTIAVLLLSYVYGIWRLKRLKGPGVDEFKAQKEPPYQGQTRGF